MAEIARCPFCRGKAKVTNGDEGMFRSLMVQCMTGIENDRKLCGAHGPYGDTKVEAIELWNRAFKSGEKPKE